MKRLFALSSALLLSFTLINPANFSDAVTISNWAKPAYLSLDEKHIIPPTLKGDKDLSETISRLEYIQLLTTYLLSNKHYDIDKYKSKFSDCDDKLLNLAAALGIANGYSDGTFKPSINITRSEAATMAYKVEEILGKAVNGSINSFKDHAYIPKWAVKGVGSMSKAGVIKGFPDKTFKPLKSITRQEAIVMVDKLSHGQKNLFNKDFEIEKGDSYFTKEQYNFILSNIPEKKFTKEIIKQRVFDTDSSRRKDIFDTFKKIPSYTPNDTQYSPNLVFDDGKTTYIVGIESGIDGNGKKERRVVMITFADPIVTVDLISKTDIRYLKEFSPWFMQD